MLRHRRHLEISEDEHENEDVIDAQRVFDHVAGEEFEGFVRPAQFPHQQIEKKREHDPDGSAFGRRAHAQFASAVLELGEIDRQRDKNARGEREPKPDTGAHGWEIFMSRGARQSQTARSSHGTYGVSPTR